MALLLEIDVPLLAVNDTTLTVVELSFANGSKVVKGDLLMVFETSKTTYDVEAGADGFIQYCCETDRDYEVGVVVARIYSEAAEALTVPAQLPSQPVRTGSAAPQTRKLSSRQESALPLIEEKLPPFEGETIFSREALRLMGSSNIDPSVFAGKDFVTAADVNQLLQPPAPNVVSRAPATQPVAVDPAKVVVEKLAKAKKREIEYLGEVQTAGLTSTLNTYVETDGIFLQLNRSFQYLRDTLLPVIIYESSRLLTDYPLLNAYFTGDGTAIYKEVNPGFAIDIDKGLKVLKVAGAGQMTMATIEAEILRLSGDYLDDRVQVEQLSDITFTITDLSAEGVAFFQPLVNKMNSAILGVSAIDTKLQRCMLSLTFDHRVTEGKTVARFLNELKQRIESYRPSAGAKRPDIACFKCFKTLDEDLGGAGFVHCVTPEGKDGYICQSCLKGF